jgi:hypothetical protein
MLAIISPFIAVVFGAGLVLKLRAKRSSEPPGS